MITTNTEYVDRFASLLADSRYKAGVSQAQLAKELGITKKTVQNWESGLSTPSLLQTLQWFRVLGINPFPYLQAFLYPGVLQNTSDKAEEDKLREELRQRIENLSIREVKDLLYILSGSHGSSPYAYLQMMLANLQTPLGDRQTVANIVQNNYRNAEAMGNLVNPDEVQPDMKALDIAIKQGIEAFRKQSNGYTGIL